VVSVKERACHHTLREPIWKDIMTGPASPRPRRGRPKVADDQEQQRLIVEAATALFLAKGYGKTSMTGIASEARMSLSTIYRFFPGKADLFAAVVASHRETMLALPGDYDGLPLDEALARIFHVNLDAGADRKREALMTMFLNATRQFPELMPILHTHGPEQSHQLLAGWLQRQHDLGFAKVDDAGTAAMMIMDTAFGAVAHKAPDAPHWPGRQDRALYLRRCFRMLARGLAPREGEK